VRKWLEGLELRIRIFCNLVKKRVEFGAQQVGAGLPKKKYSTNYGFVKGNLAGYHSSLEMSPRLAR